MPITFFLAETHVFQLDVAVDVAEVVQRLHTAQKLQRNFHDLFNIEVIRPAEICSAESQISFFISCC